MLKSFVDIRHGMFVVKTAIVSPTGFVKTKVTDRYKDLAQANERTDRLNEIWELLEAGKEQRRLLNQQANEACGMGHLHILLSANKQSCVGREY